MNNETLKKIKVWDVPTRLFHWLLAASVAFMWFSAEQGGNWLVWHLRCGLLIAFLLLFRWCWGVWGSDTARFSQFVKPAQIGRYVLGEWSERDHAGHNPLGALMVLALLAAASFQVATGLFAADENTFTNSGYLNHWFGESTGSLMRSIHVGFFNVIVLLAAVHIVTVFFYKWVKKHDLIKPMLTGCKEVSDDIAPVCFAGGVRLFAALAVAAVGVTVILLLS